MTHPGTMVDGEREDLERQLATALPSRLDLAIPIAERLAVVDSSKLSLLESVIARFSSATARHRALEEAFGGRSVTRLASALKVMEGNADRRSDDVALLVLAAAELERRRARQTELRAGLASLTSDQLDQKLSVQRQLSELDPDGEDGAAARDLLTTYNRLTALHQRLAEMIDNPLQPEAQELLRDLASAPCRPPESAALIERMSQAIASAQKLRAKRRLVISGIVASILLVLAIAIYALLQFWLR